MGQNNNKIKRDRIKQYPSSLSIDEQIDYYNLILNELYIDHRYQDINSISGIIAEYALTNQPSLDSIDGFFNKISKNTLNSEELAKILIDMDINIKDRYGWTGLARACRNNNIRLVYLLISNGANINLPNNDGKTLTSTPLIMASRYGNIEIVSLLLSYDANVNSQDQEYGYSALIEACFKGYTDIVNLLLDHDANIHLKDNGGHTALYHCRLTEIYNILRNHGAEEE